VACALCVVSELPLRTLRSRHWLAARVLGLLHLIYFGPMVIVVARWVKTKGYQVQWACCVCLTWYTSVNLVPSTTARAEVPALVLARPLV